VLVFCIFWFPMYVKRAKITTRSSATMAQRQSAVCLYTLHCTGREFAPLAMIAFYSLKISFRSVLLIKVSTSFRVTVCFMVRVKVKFSLRVTVVLCANFHDA